MNARPRFSPRIRISRSTRLFSLTLCMHKWRTDEEEANESGADGGEAPTYSRNDITRKGSAKSSSVVDTISTGLQFPESTTIRSPLHIQMMTVKEERRHTFILYYHPPKEATCLCILRCNLSFKLKVISCATFNFTR